MSGGPLRVVLCDDVPALRDLLRHGLEEDHEFSVVGEAGDVRDGLDIIRETRPDAVLLDLSMPGMDGLEAIPLILAASPGTAIVVFSGYTAARLGGLALDLGADDYVEKGADIASVRDTIRTALARRRGEDLEEGASC